MQAHREDLPSVNILCAVRRPTIKSDIVTGAKLFATRTASSFELLFGVFLIEPLADLGSALISKFRRGK